MPPTHVVRRRLAASGLARYAALPPRAWGLVRHDAQMIRRQAHWLASSREHTNLTLPLDPANEEQLAWFVATVTGAPIATIQRYADELRTDDALREHIRATTLAAKRSGLADAEARYGRRLGWYLLVRALKPRHVVECGIDKGLGTVVMAAALIRNAAGSPAGRITSIDISPDAGFLVTGPYAAVVDRVTGRSLDVIPELRSVDVFLHDSDHSLGYERAEMDAVADAMNPGALLISDNPSGVLPAYAQETGRRFLFFQERPHLHWRTGEGFGVAW